MISRRQLLLATLAASSVGVTRRVAARGRTPVGGRIAFRVPWPIGRVDPHRVDDAMAAIVGSALFESLYARTEAGVEPALAETDPEPAGTGLRVTLREKLRTATGRPLDARDAAASIARARALGASAWLADVPSPRVENDRSLFFATSDVTRLARALASPLAAVVPLSFVAEAPDGTGPYRAEHRADALVLTRNANAAEGTGFVEEIAIREARDLSDSLRAFETGADDIGWLGSGLYGKRAGARAFDAGAVGWAVLMTGRDAGAGLDVPGMAQKLCDSVPHTALSGLGVGPPWPARSQPGNAAPGALGAQPGTGSQRGWGGAPSELLVRDDCPWLIEIAKIVAGLLTSPSHELTAHTVGARDFIQRRAMRSFALAVDIVRSAEHSAAGDFAALESAGGVAAPAAPRGTNVRTMTSVLRVGVLGELRVSGARVAGVTLPLDPAGGIDWGNVTRSKR